MSPTACQKLSLVWLPCFLLTIDLLLGRTVEGRGGWRRARKRERRRPRTMLLLPDDGRWEGGGRRGRLAWRGSENEAFLCSKWG